MDWVFRIVDSSDDEGLGLIGPTVDGINDLIGKGDFSYIDRILVAVPVDTASRHVLLTLARSTFPVRQKLSGWKPFVTSLRGAFIARGLNADKLLKGLVE